MTPRCRLITSSSCSRLEGLDCSSIKVVRELGSIRRKTVWFLSSSSGDCGKPTVYERITWAESLVYELFFKEYSSAATFAESMTESISSQKLVPKPISYTFQTRTLIGVRCIQVTGQLGHTNQASFSFSFFLLCTFGESS